MAMLFQLGCAGRSQSARFYVLSPEAAPELQVKSTSAGSSDIAIGISPVSLPKYLRKPQMVTRTGSNELHLAEYDRWAGKIEEDIGRVIAENLSHMLATDKVLSYPAIEGIPLDYTINLDISRFDGRLGGDIELIVRWVLFDREGNTVAGVKATHIIEPTGGGDYADMVAAQSRALAAFSRELAAAIKELAKS
ncbi:MAG: hypothetical protein AMJ60_09880 [Desulfobacterales bacterium SG8_35]|nr:MAG: hypothetical protein AMJ60_09880 [Desulfobacterales bacterium SG8_35]